MGLGDFWLQSNNGKKYSLKDLKDLKPEDIAKNPKLQKFIKLFDLDGSGTIEIKNKDGQNEWKSIFTELQEAAVDNDLSKEEFGLYISKKLPNEDIQLEDVNELFDIASREAEQTTQKQVGNKIITTANDKVTQVITDLGNGQTEITLYEYVDATENSAAHVVLTTIKGKDHISLTKVIAVDENGDYDDNQFIYRQIRTVEDGEPVLITIGKNQNGQILEQKNKADKTIVNIYNESNIKQFDKTDSERLYQQIQYSEEEQYSAVYDGQGNTYLPIKNGEGINNFLARVNKELRKIGKPELTIADLKRLNPKIDLNNLKVANPHTGDTGMLLISGTHDADSSIVISSGTVAGNAQAQANDAMRKAAERVNNKNFKNHTLTKTYTSFEALAKELGVDVLELMTLNQSETSANGLMALTKGATVRVPVELTSSDTPEMIRKAFPLNAQNRIFYQKYNSLDESQKRNVLNVVRSMQGKSAKEIKDAILNYYPDINLFDSGLTVPIKRAMQGYQAGQSNIVSLETFITDYLKLDLRSEKGQTVYKRLLEAVQSNPLATMQNSSFGIQNKPATTDEEKYIQAVQTNLNQLAASEFPDCSKMEVHQILELLFNAGIPRTRQENEIHQSQLERNPMYQQKKREEFAADVLYNMMKQASDILHEYYSNIGYLSGDAVWQGLKNIANYATFGNVETIWKEMDKLDDMVAKAEQLKHAPNHVEFEKLFKEFTNGFAFDNDKMQNLIDVTMKVAKGELADDSTEYLNAFKGAFGSNVNLDIVADTQKSVSKQATKGSICDIVMMLTALGTIGKIGKVKQFSQWAIKALGKYGGSALVGATNLAGWTAVQKGTNLLTREADVTSDDLKDYGWEIVQSAGFGAAGGVWGNFAVSRVMGWTDKVVDKGLQRFLPKAVEKHMAKVATKVGDLFKTTSSAATTTAKSGVDVMAIAAKTPGYVAQGTGFLTEVAGFTGYQTIVDTAVSMIQQGGVGIESIQNILIQKAQMKGELTDEKLAEIKNMSYTEAMLNLLAEEGGEQLKSLGTIKGVEAAIKFIMSGRHGMVPDAASFENCKTLKGMEIKPTSVDGKAFYEITMPDGKKMVANNEHELIAFCNQQMQIDVLTNMVTEKLKKEGVEVSGVALVKTMGADRATVRTAKEGQRTSNLQVKPIKVEGQIKYEITDVDGNVRTVDNVIDVINTTQSALAIDRIEATLNKQLKNGQFVSARSLLKLVMSKDNKPITINDVEINPNDVIENNPTLEKIKISKSTIEGKEVFVITLENGKIIKETSLEGVINTCEKFFKIELMKTVIEKSNVDLHESLDDDIVTSTTQSSEPLSEKTRENITQFTTSTTFDMALSRSRINLTQFGKGGIPLKYSRENFIKELDALLSSLPPAERAEIETKFGIKIENTTFNQLGKEVVGIPIIPDNLNGTKSEQAVAELIRKFTVENEVQIADTATKELLESILHTFPEFAMTIGKKQHDTHSFSVDIHTLRNLQDNLANPKYAELDAESQLVLKYATILHDIGKRFLGDRQPDHGHAALSTEYATKILERFDLSEEVKARIIKQVKNHHWFEEYNKGNQTPELVAKVVETFGTKEDFTIAEIMAKSDYMNVNEDFHLSRKRSRVAGSGLMSNAEFENFMTSSFEKIESQFGKPENANPFNMPNGEKPRQKTAVDILSIKVENAQSRDEIVSLKQHIEELTDATEKAALMDKYFEALQKFVSEKEADLIKKIANNEELKRNPVILKLLDKVLKREDHYVGDVPDNFFGWLLYKIDLDEVLFKSREKQYMKKEELRASDLIDVLNIFIDNPVLYKNQKICELMADKAGYSFYAPEHSKFVKEGLELYVKTKELQDNPIMQEYLEILFKDIDADKKLKLFNFINEHPNLYKPSIETFIQYSTNTIDFDTVLELWGKNKDGSLGEVFFCIQPSEKDYKVNNARLYFLKKYGDISVSNITDKNYKFFMKLSENNISADFLKKYIDVLNENNLQSIQRLDKLGKISSEDIVTIARDITELNKELIENLCELEDVSPRDISKIASGTRNKVALKFAKELCEVPDLPKHYISQVLTYAQKDRISLLRELCLDKDFREATGDTFGSTISYVCETNKEFVKKMCKDRILDDREINFITARSQDKKDHDLIKKMYESEDIDKKCLKALIEVIRDENIEYLEKFYFNKDIPKELLAKINYSLCFLGENNAQYAEHLLLNYKKFGIFEEQIGTLIERSYLNSNEAFDLNVISKLNQQLGKENVLKLSNIELVVCMNNINLIGKKSLNDLSKTEKRNLLNTLLVNKNNIESNNLANLKDIMPILPQSTEEYVRNIDLIKNGLHMNENDRLSADAQKAFNKSIEDLSILLKTTKSISDIRLSHSHKEFVEKINSILKDLPPEEQLKIQELFGFKIVNGKLTGYPNVNLSAENYTNKELFDKIKQEVEAYLDNQVIIENNPQLSNILNGIIKNCPELLNQIDESGDFTKVLQQLQITLSKKEFKDLSNDDKQIVILAHLFGNTDKHLNTRVDAACEGYFISQKLGLSKEMSQKLYAIIEMLNAPDEFMATSKKTTIRDYRGTILEGQERQDVFDLLAFKLKEGNLFNLTKLVYDSKYPEGFTDRFNNLLSHRIREIKANDFSLLQTASSTYRSLARRTDVLSNNKVYSVDVVNAEDIPNFYALAHTPEAGFASGGSRDANFANFKLFEMVGDDKVICTGYITAEKAGLVKSFHHGFIFEVPNDKQYVGYGTDIFSLGKTIPDMVVEYFRDRGYEANRNRGDKWSHRTFISKALKRELYGIVGSKLKGVDDKYIARLDNIKAKLGSKPLTLENLRQIDPEFADAYVRAINSKGWGIFYKKLLKEFEHNEVLVSNPKISAIFTDNIDNIPEEYLIKAQEENLPIVVIK